MNVANMKLRQVINASGKMTILGNSTLTDDIVDAMRLGGQSYYEMADLVVESGRVIAEESGTEAAWVVSSASAGIALSVAGLVTEHVLPAIAIEQLNQGQPEKEIIIMRGHLVDYGAPISTMITLGGAKVKEVGYANGCTLDQLEANITENTIGILYVQSHHCVQKNMPKMHEVYELAKYASLPLIADIAAEESFQPYKNDADILIMSGSKAIEGPTSGIVAGKERYIKAMQVHQFGIGRAMKVGKETIFGLIEAFMTSGEHKQSIEAQKQLLQPLYVLNNISGISISFIEDESGRDIVRARVTIDEQRINRTASAITAALLQGDVAIYTRDYLANVGCFDIDPRPLTEEDVQMIVTKIRHIVGEAND